MKRKTAEKNLKTIISRLHQVNGILATPNYNQNAVRIKRAWLFGSFAKGKDEPNDLDIFVEVIYVPPERFYIEEHRYKLLGCFKPDKAYSRSYGMIRPAQSDEYFVKWLRKSMKMISVHFVGDDRVFDRLDKKILIYPRCDFNFELEDGKFGHD